MFNHLKFSNLFEADDLKKVSRPNIQNLQFFIIRAPEKTGHLGDYLRDDQNAKLNFTVLSNHQERISIANSFICDFNIATNILSDLMQYLAFVITVKVRTDFQGLYVS